MGRSLAEAFPVAARTFQEADEVLGLELSSLMWDGPQEELVLTMNAQPAILTHSIAVLRLAQDRLGPVSMAAGHSLGEYSAHVAAGTLTFEEALRVVRLRGELMAEAGSARPGTMAAVLGLRDADVGRLCEEASDQSGSIVVAANFNAPGQVVVSGDLDAVRCLEELAGSRGAKRVVPLTVSGAFHSPLMKPAEDRLRERLESLELQRSSFPVYCNVDARPVSDPELAMDALTRQLTRPVRWAESVRAMLADGATRFVEMGPGSVLVGLNRRNARGVTSLSVGEPAQLHGLASG